MRSSNRFNSRSFLFALVLGLPLSACGGSEAPPAVAPPPAPPPPATASATPAPPAPQPAATAAVEAPPAPKPKFDHRHALVGLLLTSLDSLQLTAEQKTTTDGIKADLAKHTEPAKEPRLKLDADVLAGVTAGKLDQAKIDADIRALSAAVVATETPIQDDMNRLHKALTPEQRKKLIETAREKGKEMHAHGMAMHEHGGKGGEHEHGMAAPEHGGKGGEHEHAGKGGEHEHDGKGGEQDGKGMWEGPLAKLAEELALTPEQSAKIRSKVEALVKAEQVAMKDQMAAAMKHMAEVGAAFESDKFDAKKAGVATQAPALVSSIATAHVKFVQAVLSELTPEQRAKFAAHIQAHNAEMD